MTELWDPAIADDLEAFVLFAYPWGKENTPLHNHQGPRSWQRDELQKITAHLKAQPGKMDVGLTPEMRRAATASGRGIGKSALVSWLANWMMTTRLGSTTIVTANTEPQLKTRTFAEIGKWTTLLINSHWWEPTVLSVRPAEWYKHALNEQLKIDTQYFYCMGQTWSEENPDAFAGVHNPAGVMLVFDEASGIPVPIFSVSEGFFTEPTLNRFWSVYSNPRRNSGGFYDCFNEHKAYWRLRQVDSRTVEGTDLQIFERIIKQYGIESDTVKVEVLGQFPSQGTRQFISNQLVQTAQTRTVEPDLGAPLI
ncbi:MAG: terminase, partial [Nitrospira sp.]